MRGGVRVSTFQHECSEENAPKFWEWLRTRGGIAVWKSINLGNAGASWSTPATTLKSERKGCGVPETLCPKCFKLCVTGKVPCSTHDYWCEHCGHEFLEAAALTPYPKTNWQMESTPTIYTDPADVGVFTSALYKAFKVGLKRGDGFSFVLTDAANGKVKRLLAACEEKHGDSFYRKGVLDIEGASIGIYYTTGIIPITEWAAKNGSELQKVEVEQ